GGAVAGGAVVEVAGRLGVDVLPGEADRLVDAGADHHGVHAPRVGVDRPADDAVAGAPGVHPHRASGLVEGDVAFGGGAGGGVGLPVGDQQVVEPDELVGREGR